MVSEKADALRGVLQDKFDQLQSRATSRLQPQQVGEEGDIEMEAIEPRTGEDIAEDVGEDVAEEAGEEAGDVALEAGAEAVGTALDATGVGAVIGVPLQIAGLVGMGVGAYDLGKDAVDWFKQDILGETPPNPPKPVSIAQKGGMVVPTFDSVSNIPSSVGSW